MPLERIERLSDDEIVARLTAVRGIGRWTAEMFLIFHLRRLDVWPVDDFAVRKGYGIIHGLSRSRSRKPWTALGEPFRPYRSVAAWYCWRATDTVRGRDGQRADPVGPCPGEFRGSKGLTLTTTDLPSASSAPMTASRQQPLERV